MQLLHVIENWTRSLDQVTPIDCCYLDFKKAFDSVAHKRLLIALRSLGINGNLLIWIQAFITDRKQRVVLEGVASDWVEVKSGVPQGSVLGPLLFISMLQTLPLNIRSSIMIYADDTKLYRPVTSQDDAEELQKDLNMLTKWTETWQLPFNYEKCVVMHIGSSNQSFSYSMKGLRLDETAEEKDLGIIVDKSLKFHSQTSAVVAKAFRQLGIIKRAFVNLDEITLPLLYKSMVRPILEYCNTVWGPIMCGDQDRIERVQRRATKMVAAIRHLPYQERLRKLDLPSMHYRRARGDMITVFQLLTGKVQMDHATFFSLAPPESSTRGHSLKLLKPTSESAIRQRFFSNRVINSWNDLPEQVIRATTTNQFKNRLDDHWKSKLFETRQS